ncbi:MAG: class I SAM-dependent methyltransferase [Actinomycetota bacterium]|nr:class I SAM-dependent methyltransferase [Actinomycetota bacterium]
MAHQLLFDLVADLVEAVDMPDPVVEFGSMQVEEWQPNDLRPLFAGRDFTGTDFRAGPGVDRVEDLRELGFADEEVGTALCLETLEHCEDPFAACRELHRVISPGGICVVSSVMLFGIHGYPNDYWRFTPEGLRVLLDRFDDVSVASMGDPESPVFVFGIGAKGRKLGVELAEMPSIRAAQQAHENAYGKVRLGPMRYSLRDLARDAGSQLPRVVRERLAAKRAS